MTLTFTEDDLTQWIAKNRMLFLMNRKHYSPDHVAFMARLGGFPAEMVYRRLSHFDHMLARTSIDRSAMAKSRWFVSEVLMPYHLDLIDQWKALDLHDTMGLDFDEVA